MNHTRLWIDLFDLRDPWVSIVKRPLYKRRIVLVENRFIVSETNWWKLSIVEMQMECSWQRSNRYNTNQCRLYLYSNVKINGNLSCVHSGKCVRRENPVGYNNYCPQKTSVYIYCNMIWLVIICSHVLRNNEYVTIWFG